MPHSGCNLTAVAKSELSINLKHKSCSLYELKCILLVPEKRTVEICIELNDFLFVSHFTWWRHKRFKCFPIINHVLLHKGMSNLASLKFATTGADLGFFCVSQNFRKSIPVSTNFQKLYQLNAEGTRLILEITVLLSARLVS